MAEIVESPIVASAAHAFVTAFPESSLALIEPLRAAMAGTKVDPAAAKRLERARMLHNVISAKLPQLKEDDLRKMSIEWVLGLLDATFPLETSLVDADCADRTTLDMLLATLDGAHHIGRQLAALQSEPQTAKAGAIDEHSDEGSNSTPTPKAACGSSDDAPKPPPTAEEASALLQSAVAAGAQFQDVVPGSSPEAAALGYELWEALCWRRGSLRYYMVSTAVNASLEFGGKAAGAKDESAAAIIARAGAASASSVELIAEAHAALNLLLCARNERTDLQAMGAGAPPMTSTAHMATALRYGIYSTTHLLALAFDAELCYWRWAATACKGAAEHASSASSTPAAADAPPDAPVDVSESAVSAAPSPPQPAAAAAEAAAPPSHEEAESEVWYRRACVCAHRYLHTVEVLMEGCGWDVTRTRELLRLLSAGQTEATAVALEGEEGVAKQMAALSLGGEGGGGKKKKGKKK